MKGAILHSNQCLHFTNPAYIRPVTNMGLTQSISRRGNCWDNACIENCFGHLTCKMPCFCSPQTVEEVRQAVMDYIHYIMKKRIQTNMARARLNTEPAPHKDHSFLRVYFTGTSPTSSYTVRMGKYEKSTEFNNHLPSWYSQKGIFLNTTTLKYIIMRHCNTLTIEKTGLPKKVRTRYERVFRAFLLESFLFPN
jgi:transposase InsO family protein